MKISKLEEFLHDGDEIRRTQKEYEKYYAEAQKAEEVAGSYKGIEYITLSRKEHISEELEAMVNWPEQVSPYHIHNWVELAYMYSGKCDIVVKDLELTLEEGQFILLDTKVPHSIGKTGGDNILINFLFDKHYLNHHFFNQLTEDSVVTRFFVEALNEQTNHDKYLVFYTEKSERVPKLVRFFLCEYYDGSICKKDILNSCMTMIICELIHSYQQKEGERTDKSKDLRMAAVLRYIENNYVSCTLEETALFFSISPNYLTSQIKKYTGYSYKELVQQNRLKQAGRLLRNTEFSVREIANQIGYENIGFFNKKFFQMYGCRPSEYRHPEPVQ